MEKPRSEPVRVCIFGAPPDADWLAGVTRALPAGTGIDALADQRNAADALRAAAARFPGADLILLHTGTALPEFWFERMTLALDLADVLVASPLDNVDPNRTPLPVGTHSNADPALIDALCYRYGRREVLDWPTFSPLLSAWHGATLRGLDLSKIHNSTLPEDFAPRRAVLLDHLYVADPAQTLRGPQAVVPGADAPPPSALGELRENVAAALARVPKSSAGYPGLDAKPVILHVLHGWGGGSERFVRDLAATDRTRHHLVLVARGNFERRRYGETLELLDNALSQPPLRQLHLSDPIPSTRLADRTYRAFLDAIVRDFGVDAIIVSSLIGHSLDALRTGLPITYVVHDCYPLWPLLHRNLDEPETVFDAARLRTELACRRRIRVRRTRRTSGWRCAAWPKRPQGASAPGRAEPLRAGDLSEAAAAAVHIAPKYSARHRLLAASVALPLPAPPARGIAPARARPRARRQERTVARQALPALREHAELFLLGAARRHGIFGHLTCTSS